MKMKKNVLLSIFDVIENFCLYDVSTFILIVIHPITLAIIYYFADGAKAAIAPFGQKWRKRKRYAVRMSRRW